MCSKYCGTLIKQDCVLFCNIVVMIWDARRSLQAISLPVHTFEQLGLRVGMDQHSWRAWCVRLGLCCDIRQANVMYARIF